MMPIFIPPDAPHNDAVDQLLTVAPSALSFNSPHEIEKELHYIGSWKRHEISTQVRQAGNTDLYRMFIRGENLSTVFRHHQQRMTLIRLNAVTRSDNLTRRVYQCQGLFLLQTVRAAISTLLPVSSPSEQAVFSLQQNTRYLLGGGGMSGPGRWCGRGGDVQSAASSPESNPSPEAVEDKVREKYLMFPSKCPLRR
jgi:hypothetical protein